MSFVVVFLILNLPRASNSSSVYFVLRARVYQRFFSQSLIHSPFPFVAETAFFHILAFSPAVDLLSLVTQCLLTSVGARGRGVFCWPGSSTALGSCWVGALLVFLTQVPSEVRDGLELEHFPVFFPCLRFFSDPLSQSLYGFPSVG